MLDSLKRILDACRSRWIAARPTLADLPSPTKKYRKLERLVVADGVLRTLFDDFDKHRATARGEEEIGWALLGVRDEAEAIAVAALPAGAQRHASLTHVQFHSNAQAVATRLLRQHDKRLGLLGVVHTHPGSLRHPSSGDYRGDVEFVTRLRGKEGVFAIGTADASSTSTSIEQPQSFQHVRGPLTFHWYALGEHNDFYRKLDVVSQPGEDAARSLSSLWPTLETHADAIERLCQQLNGVRLEAVEASISVAIPLADDVRRLRVLLRGPDSQYYVEDAGDLLAVDPHAAALDHGVYSVLAELAKRRSGSPA